MSASYKALKKLQESGYLNPYGVWQVSTEGDVEGRTTRQLGAYEGYIDEIALRLADQCYYSLNFKKAKALPAQSKHTAVSVHLDNASGTWDLSSIEREFAASEIFKDRPVHITESKYFASFTINAGKDPKQVERARIAALQTSALAKIEQYLTQEERDALFKAAPKRSQ
jgi:hypothetical protein